MVFAISDLHLSFSVDKPMEIFGEVWENHFLRISEDWKNKVTNDDTVLLAGDLSWAMTLEHAAPDIDAVCALPGKKIIIRGNHDYWWQSYTRLAARLRERGIYALQNNAIIVDGVVYCGSRGWTLPAANKTADDEKIYNRELIRLEMSLKEASALRGADSPVVAMLHFPPFDTDNADTEFTRLFEKYSVDKVVYGHLHGKYGRNDIALEKNGVEYYLTSCDKLGNKLLKILP